MIVKGLITIRTNLEVKYISRKNTKITVAVSIDKFCLKAYTNTSSIIVAVVAFIKRYMIC